MVLPTEVESILFLYKNLLKNSLDEILSLREKGLRSCVLLPLGYRDIENDWLVNLKKVRKSREDLITEVE